MDDRQYCGSSRRRQRVADNSIDIGGGLLLNGIDHVEVVDHDAPSKTLRQRLLDITFIRPDGLFSGTTPLFDSDNFIIEGGTRIRDIAVISVAGGSGDRTLRLTLNSAGDFSPYRLRLRGGVLNENPPMVIDRQLSEVEFLFKVECPTDFDCKAPEIDAPGRHYGPPIDYLARDYEGLRRLMLDRMSVTLPGWNERNPADLGVALVETLAAAADRTSWFQDAVGTEAFFEKTRLRQSLVRHSRLLGYRPDEGCNARVAIAVTAESDREGGSENPVIPAGTRFLSRPPESPRRYPVIIPRDPNIMEEMVGAGAVIFEALESLTSIATSRNAIYLHNWGDEECCLPPGATEAYLIGSSDKLKLSTGDLLIFEELIPFTGTEDDPPDPKHRQLVRLNGTPVDIKDPLLGIDLVHIKWHSGDALTFPLTLSSKGAVATGNVLLADQGRTVDYSLAPAAAGEDAYAVGKPSDTGLLPDDGPGQRLRNRVAAGEIVHAQRFDEGEARRQAAAATLAAEGETVAAITLRGEGHRWVCQPDLLASDRFAAHFKFEPANDGGGYILFGDGVGGRQPTNGTKFTATVRHGGGRHGNVVAGAIAHIVTGDGEGITSIRNPLAAMGGRDRESVQSIRTAAPHRFKTQRRSVTPSDYARAAEQHPRVQRASASRRWTGSWHTIFLAIDPVGGVEMDDDFRAHLRTYLSTSAWQDMTWRSLNPIMLHSISLFMCVSIPTTTLVM